MANYPYFASVTRQIGRLNRLQGDIHSKKLQKHVVEIHGDTESVRRAASRLQKSLTQWGVLEQLSTSTFHVKSGLISTDRKLLSWLAVSSLLCSDRARLDVAEIYSDPAFFPFIFDNQLMKPETNQIVEVVHQGMSETVIAINSAVQQERSESKTAELSPVATLVLFLRVYLQLERYNSIMTGRVE